MKTKAIVIRCDKCGATDILRKVGDGPSQTTDVEGYENRRPGWVSVMRYSDNITRTRELCPVCSKEYSELFENFWKDGIAVQDD